MLLHAGPPYIELTTRGEDAASPTLTELVSFLKNFNELYEIMRLNADPRFIEYMPYTPDFSESGAPPLREEERLRIVRLTQRSPLFLVTALTATPTAIASIWGLLQIAEKIQNWSMNRELLRQQLDKLRFENSKMERDSSNFYGVVEEEPPAFINYDLNHPYSPAAAMAALSENPVRVQSIEVKIRKPRRRRR